MAAAEIFSGLLHIGMFRPARKIGKLELHLVHACNLTCESCSHYSNQGHKGMLSLKDADDWMRLWKRRIRPKQFSLLGGEPTMHPDLPQFIVLARKHWSRAHVRVMTNGFFLHRHPDLPKVVQKDPNASIYVSVHHDAPEYLEKFGAIRELLDGWVRDYGIRVTYFDSYKNWTRRYKGFGPAIEPFEDGQPRESWGHCPAKYCPQLFEGRIWKCAPLAYLRMQDDRHHLSEKWKPYLQYQALQPDCTPKQLNEFFEREEEPACGMCPARPERFELPLPLKSANRAASAQAIA